MASKPPDNPMGWAETFLVQAMVRDAFRRLDPEVMQVLDERRRSQEVDGPSPKAHVYDTRNRYNQVGHRQETYRGED